MHDILKKFELLSKAIYLWFNWKKRSINILNCSSLIFFTPLMFLTDLEVDCVAFQAHLSSAVILISILPYTGFSADLILAVTFHCALKPESSLSPVLIFHQLGAVNWLKKGSAEHQLHGENRTVRNHRWRQYLGMRSLGSYKSLWLGVL